MLVDPRLRQDSIRILTKHKLTIWYFIVLDTNDYGYYFLAAIRCHRTKYIKPITACKFNPPIWYRSLGRDMLSMIMVGAKHQLLSFCRGWDWGAFGVPLGLFAANWRGGFIDDGIMRFNDLVFAFPSLVIAISLLRLLGQVHSMP